MDHFYFYRVRHEDLLAVKLDKKRVRGTSTINLLPSFRNTGIAHKSRRGLGRERERGGGRGVKARLEGVARQGDVGG